MNKLLVTGFYVVLALSLAGCGTMTPLGRAANRGNIAEVEQLLNAGEDVNKGILPLGSILPLNEATLTMSKWTSCNFS